LECFNPYSIGILILKQVQKTSARKACAFVNGNTLDHIHLKQVYHIYSEQQLKNLGNKDRRFGFDALQHRTFTCSPSLHCKRSSLTYLHSCSRVSGAKLQETPGKRLSSWKELSSQI